MNYGRKPILFVAISAGLLCGCSKSEKPLAAYDAQYLDYFDTITSITINAKSEKEFEKYKSLAEDTLEKYHELFDIYDNYDGVNNVKTINDNAGIAPVEVDKELIDLLELSREEYELTGGKVNVAMGSVLSIWHTYREEGLADPAQAKIPDMQELKQAAEHMDFEQVQIDPQASTVYLPDEEMSLDVGAIAKGYATKRLAETLKEAGVTSAVLSLGGNVETIGTKANGTPWRVGVQICDRFLKASNGLVKFIGLAPEESSNAIEFIQEVKDRVNVSLAHTNADYETAATAFAAGANHALHLYNAMPEFTHRQPGVVGAVFDNKHVMAEIICDGIHIHPATIRATFRMMGADRMILISDSIRATGMPDGQYTLGGQDVKVVGKRATLGNTDTIAGSATNLMDCMRTAVKQMGLPLEVAVGCATINPARSLDIDDQYGSIEAGKKAHVVLLDKELNLTAVIKDGVRIC